MSGDFEPCAMQSLVIGHSCVKQFPKTSASEESSWEPVANTTVDTMHMHAKILKICSLWSTMVAAKDAERINAFLKVT